MRHNESSSKRKFTAVNTHIAKNTVGPNTVMMHLKVLESKNNPKASTRKEIIKVTAETNETETKMTMQRINEFHSWLFKRINKILANLIANKQDISQFSKKESRDPNQCSQK